MNYELIEKVKEYVLSLLQSRISSNHVYHDVDHTRNVAEATEIIGRASNLSNEELEIVIIAAWFHDLGYVEKVEGHEEISAEFAEEFLLKENYPIEKIEKIKKCILATKVPQNPQNILEEVICDADLSHLGKKSFKHRNDLFREEFEFYFGRQLTEAEWIKKSIDFLNNHKFFTEFARREYDAQKSRNLEKLKEELRKLS
ncbi:MAG: HD domain-containing protein [Melioribacter sp.]|uniref:HD domain-containing protein n=1 Tax=Rosettibacter primus TaxID=3111523 RepID=UPI00247E36EE|nr:HD domain-containing protein [Melioribacter sp.]